jgi:uncharacterized repeat protein (TIGR03803 family)
MSFALRQIFPQTISRTAGAVVLSAVLIALLATTLPALAQTETILYSFCPQTVCSEGAQPEAGLVMDASGNLYGTTEYGGAFDDGAVFKLSPDGTETVLHSFKGRKGDGTEPLAPLMMDAKGNLFGTASAKGAHNGGTVFKISPSGTETILYNFCTLSDCTDGNQPLAGLIHDKAGNLYGTTAIGGTYNLGTVFKLTPSGVQTVLYSFGGIDGSVPWAALVMDGQGNLYGTTYSGGDLSLCNGQGCGTVFKLAANGTESVLYSFCSQQGATCTDGTNPRSGLLLDKKGNLYGTADLGGTTGNGMVFRISPQGVETVVHSFAGYPDDGGRPLAGLVMDSAGTLYGTTYQGGTDNDGAVFKIRNTGAVALLHSFSDDGTDGFWPVGTLLLDSAGNLKGTASYGGADHTDGGTVFTIAP